MAKTQTQQGWAKLEGWNPVKDAETGGMRPPTFVNVEPIQLPDGRWAFVVDPTRSSGRSESGKTLRISRMRATRGNVTCEVNVYAQDDVTQRIRTATRTQLAALRREAERHALASVLGGPAE